MEPSFFDSPPAFVPPLAAASETVHARIVRDLATAGWSVCGGGESTAPDVNLEIGQITGPDEIYSETFYEYSN